MYVNLATALIRQTPHSWCLRIANHGDQIMRLTSGGAMNNASSVVDRVQGLCALRAEGSIKAAISERRWEFGCLVGRTSCGYFHVFDRGSRNSDDGICVSSKAPSFQREQATWRGAGASSGKTQLK